MSLDLDIQQLLKDPKTALLPILRTINGWEQANADRVKVSQISGAMTNLVYRCSYTTLSKKYHALARVFGSAGGLFGREDEQQVFSAVADAGLGPKVLALFPDGRIEEFIEAQSVSAELMATPELAVSIAAAMAHFHFSMLKHFTMLDHLPSCMSPVAQIWDRLRDWARICSKQYTTEELQQYGLHNIHAEIDALQHTLTAQQPGWLGFCHNDLQYGNMLLAAHTTAPQPQSLLPADDNVTQGLGREDALTGLGDKLLGSSADLNPLLANLLSENLEGMSPRKEGLATGAFWDGHPSFSKARSPRVSDASARKSSSLSNGSASEATDASARKSSSLSNGSGSEAAGTSALKSSSVSNGSGYGAADASQAEATVSDQLEDMDPAQILTQDSGLTQGVDEAGESSGAEPDQLPSQLSNQLQISTRTAHPPADAHIRLIDYEYAGVNPVALDLANHWCEYAADYHTDTPHILDYTRFPDHEHRAGFVHAYIETVVSMSKKHGDKLSWDGGEISYSAPAPGAMQIHTDTNCNQSLYSKDTASTSRPDASAACQSLHNKGAASMSVPDGSEACHTAIDNGASSAPAVHEGSLQGSLGGPSAPPFHKHSSVQKLKEAVIDNMKKVVSSPKQQPDGGQDCSTCRPGDAACADHVEPLLPELLRKQSRSEDIDRIKDELHTAAMAYVPISHLMWGLWGLIQAKTSNCEYDFIEYSRQRLEQYHITKPSMSTEA